MMATGILAFISMETLLSPIKASLRTALDPEGGEDPRRG